MKLERYEEYWGRFFRSKTDLLDFIEITNGNKTWLFAKHIGTTEVSWLSLEELKEDYDEIQPEIALPQIINE